MAVTDVDDYLNFVQRKHDLEISFQELACEFMELQELLSSNVAKLQREVAVFYKEVATS